MIKENKASKYLMYAIGEIALVMIGILLALQVSNWNENRIKQQNEVKILSQLNEDLKVNLTELTGIYEALNNSSSGGLKIINFLTSNKPSNDSLKIWTENFKNSNIFNNANTTYKNLENSEKNIISNDSLRLRITLMYELEFLNVHTRERFWYEEYYPKYIQEFYKNFKVGAVQNPWLKGQTLEVNTPRNTNNLRKNETFKNVLVEAYNFRLIRILWLGETIEKLKKLILDINKEVESLK